MLIQSSSHRLLIVPFLLFLLGGCAAVGDYLNGAPVQVTELEVENVTSVSLVGLQSMDCGYGSGNWRQIGGLPPSMGQETLADPGATYSTRSVEAGQCYHLRAQFADGSQIVRREVSMPGGGMRWLLEDRERTQD